MSDPYAPPPPTEFESPPIEARLVEPPPPESWAGHLQSRPALLAAIFLVLGAFGIPLLWTSGKFSRLERIVWSVLALLYTLAMIALLVLVIRWIIARSMPVT